jgi:F-type H+-transporting ATPase subunit delta
MATSRTKEYAQALLELTDPSTGSGQVVRDEAEVTKVIKDFVIQLAKKKMIRNADTIIEQYRAMYNKKHNIVEATVTLVSRLSEKTRVELRETLKKKFKAREVHMLEKVDARLLGGMKIKVGDTVYDSSLKNSLNQLESQLLR